MSFMMQLKMTCSLNIGINGFWSLINFLDLSDMYFLGYNQELAHNTSFSQFISFLPTFMRKESFV